MQRVRIGLTGLAGVLVLVLFAAAVLGLRSSEPRAPATSPKDPLAELGVTPGGGGDTAPAAASRSFRAAPPGTSRSTPLAAHPVVRSPAAAAR